MQRIVHIIDAQSMQPYHMHSGKPPTIHNYYYYYWSTNNNKNNSKRVPKHKATYWQASQYTVINQWLLLQKLSSMFDQAESWLYSSIALGNKV